MVAVVEKDKPVHPRVSGERLPGWALLLHSLGSSPIIVKVPVA